MPRIISLLLALLLSAVPAAAQTTADCPASQFLDFDAVGTVTPGEPNNLRAEPSLSAARIGRIFPGEPFNIVYRSPICADGFLWVEIETVDQRGWTVERPLEGGDAFLVPYSEPEPVTVGKLQEDGTLRVEAGGVAFTAPAGLGLQEVTLRPDVGLFGTGGMSAQPSSVIFNLVSAEEHINGMIEFFPYDTSPAIFAYWRDNDLEPLLTEQPPLFDAVPARMPYLPYDGSAPLFRGVPVYLPFVSGVGLRYITYFAQTSVIFDASMTFDFEFRGLTADRRFLIAGRFGVGVPEAAIPAEMGRTDEAYVSYVRQFEASLAAQPTSAFAPDLALYDALLASLTVMDADALLALIP